MIKISFTHLYVRFSFDSFLTHRFLNAAFLVLLILISVDAAGLPSSSVTITKYEAEDALLTGVSISKSGTGFSGTGYMDGGTFDAAGDKITFTVNVATTAAYPLIIRFQNSCGSCEKAQNISINRGPDAYTSFIGTSSSWQDLNFGNINLKAGSNTIAISKSWGWTSIDYIGIGENDVTAPTAPSNLKTSARSQTSFTLNWDASADDVDVTGYDIFIGNSKVSSTTNTSITLSAMYCNTNYSVTVKAKDKAGNVSETSNALSVTTNACVLYSLTVNNGSGSGSYNSGTNVKITANAAPSGKIFDKWTGPATIEHVSLSATTVTMPETGIEITATYKDVDPALLLDPAATNETVTLWNYLKSIYGQKMLTGCWTETQFGGNAKVVSCTGKTPAIWGQDMNSWYRSRTETNWINTWNSNIQGFKTAHNRGQIIQVNWHWQMPSSKVNGVYTRDAWGRNSANVSQMMTNQQWIDIVTPGTVLYDAMIEDIDYHVVNFLKKLIDKNGKPIPIIFRPLHEIDGGWFWWTCTSDPTKTARLYKILQDRIINYHGCHNLIWVYNPGVSCNGGSNPPYQASEFARRKAFYPGDAFCDITGIDLYEFDPEGRGTFSNTGKTYRDSWNMMKAIAPAKMVALCESEGMPDVAKSFTDPDYAPWLYCLPWYSESYTDGTTGITRDLCAWNKIQFLSPYAVNTGDFMITAIKTNSIQQQSRFSVYPNPAIESVTITFYADVFHTKSKVTLTDLSGKIVYQTEDNFEKNLSISTSRFAKGMYILNVSDGSMNFCDKLIIK